MRLGVAYFGDLGRKHGLLACTPEYRALFLEISNRTDRPGYTPPDAAWPPYISGFAHQGHYYLMRTFADDSASRGGMVFTAAFVAPVEQFALIEDLRVVVDALPVALIKQSIADLPALELPDSDLAAPRHERVPPQLAQALVANAAPIVWGDPGTFVEVVVNLWGRMWPNMREVFSFRMSFDPNDIDQQNPPTLVTTLPEVRSRWVSNPVISPTALPSVVEPAAAIFTGDAAGSRLSELRRQLQSNIADFRELRLVQALATSIDSPQQTFSSRRSQLQLVAKLSPDPAKGLKLKTSLAEGLCVGIPEQTSAAEVRGLRNIPWETLPPIHSVNAFNAVTNWVATNSLRNSSASDSFETLVGDAFNDSSRWGTAIYAGLKRALDIDDPGLVVTLWSWILGGLGSCADRLLKLYLTDSVRENRFADSCPNLDNKSDLYKKLNDLCKKQGWHELHAAVVLNNPSPSAALALHLKLLGANAHAGIERFRIKLGNKQFFVTSLESNDLRLVDSALRSLAEDPDEWTTFSAENPFWRAVLVKSLSVGEPNALPQNHRVRVLSDMLNNLATAPEPSPSADEALWKCLVDLTPDWSDLRLSGKVWHALPPGFRTAVFDASAIGWLTKFLTGAPVAIPDSTELRRWIAEEFRVRGALQRHRNASTAIQLFEQFTELPEALFVWWMRQILPLLEVSQPTALRMGTLIATRHWRTAADEFAFLSNDKVSLQIGLEPCVPLLSMLRRVRLLISGTSQTHDIDLWQALQEVGLQLYSYGPGEADLWQRAGGDPSDLPYFTSGRQAWSTVIQDAKNGRHAVTISSLLAAMLHDFPNNPDLKQIARLSNEPHAR
jgi:hypothetical protein